MSTEMPWPLVDGTAAPPLVVVGRRVLLVILGVMVPILAFVSGTLSCSNTQQRPAFWVVICLVAVCVAALSLLFYRVWRRQLKVVSLTTELEELRREAAEMDHAFQELEAEGSSQAPRRKSAVVLLAKAQPAEALSMRSVATFVLGSPKKPEPRDSHVISSELPPRGALSVPRPLVCRPVTMTLLDMEMNWFIRPGDPIRAALKSALEPEARPPPAARLSSKTCSRDSNLFGSSRGSDARAQHTSLAPSEYLKVLRSCAARLRDPKYSLRDFHGDIQRCFPELRLYLNVPVPQPGTTGGGVAAGGKSSMTSGLSGKDEYMRTMGALFAVYWLSRLELPEVHGSSGMDGQRGFCFGVDQQWSAPTEAEVQAIARKLSGQLVPETLAQKQATFLRAMDWRGVHELLIDAAVLRKTDAGGAAVQEERMMAMLALTAIHDIMKVEVLLPTVLPEHAPFCGFAAGDMINDHDIALGYVLQHDAESLPCFANLPEELKRPIRFTQAKLGFNHGWLVQAEAPPGALFGSFKALLETEAAAEADVAFYFVHWLTDLAGAEPSGGGPMCGSLKFTTKFPHTVLTTFVRSFPIVQRLAELSCTELNEAFLSEWWPEALLGPPPEGATSIALKRLVVQAQTVPVQQAVHRAFLALPPAEVQTLAEEMARTGRAGESYSATPHIRDAGPAFLVYYGPALLRKAATEQSAVGLRSLTEIYRAARQLWPLSAEHAARTVTLRVDLLKAVETEQIVETYTKGQAWCLKRASELEGAVQLLSLDDLPRILGTCDAAAQWRILKLWGVDSQPIGLAPTPPTVRTRITRRISAAGQPGRTAPRVAPAAPAAAPGTAPSHYWTEGATGSEGA